MWWSNIIGTISMDHARYTLQNHKLSSFCSVLLVPIKLSFISWRGLIGIAGLIQGKARMKMAVTVSCSRLIIFQSIFNFPDLNLLIETLGWKTTKCLTTFTQYYMRSSYHTCGVLSTKKSVVQEINTSDARSVISFRKKKILLIFGVSKMGLLGIFVYMTYGT